MKGSKLKHLHIVRSYTPTATIGYCDVNGTILQTLEQPWRDNEPDRSCIPEGTYLVKRDKTGRHQWFAVQNVPNRTFIEWHVANYVSQLEGCTSFGMSRASDNESVNRSQDALEYLLSYLGDEDFFVTYRSFSPASDIIFS